MSIRDRLKKQFLTDAVVIGVIIIAGIVFFAYTSSQRPGWDIKGDDIRMESEKKRVESHIFLRKEGSLSMEDSELKIATEFDDQFGIFLNGNVDLNMKDSAITGEDFTYFFNTETQDSESPRIQLEDSDIIGHSGILMTGDSSLFSDNSDIGQLWMSDDATAELIDTTVFPVFLSDEEEVYENLTAGEITRKIESEEGWVLDMKRCDVDGYQIDIYEEDEVLIKNSTDLTISIFLPGDLEEQAELTIPTGSVSSGSLEKTGSFLVEWIDTQFDALNLYARGEDVALVTKSRIADFALLEDAAITLRELELVCRNCETRERSKLTLDSITISDAEDQPQIVAYGSSEITIQNSDISNLSITLYGSSTLTLINTIYVEENIDNQGDGGVVVE